VAEAVLPAASLAVTVMMLSSPQWRGRPEIVQLFVRRAVPFPLYHADVKKVDLPKIDSTQPELYGKPLQRTLKGNAAAFSS
jgi:hypothetical protein